MKKPNTMKHCFVRLAALLSLSAILGSCGTGSEAECGQLRVIPYPAHVEVRGGTCDLAKFRTIGCLAGELAGEARFLAARLAEAGIDVTVGSEAVARGIMLSLDASIDSPEGYRLQVAPKRIEICGATPAGVFYGIQTLLQELENGAVRCGTVEDAPRYAWRGFMLDEARHFSGEKRVKELLDRMAAYKLNRFHWHLTDAQGWRIEILKYPDLALVGGEGTHSDPDTPAQYYTQAQIRDIVAYAAERHIEVIPEIDMPGHASASNKAYPQYSGGGTAQFPEFTFHVGKEATYAYLTDILREVAALFPSKWLHIGGDEVSYGSDAWKTDPQMKAFMRSKGMTTVEEAEGYFIRRMSDTVRMLGKIPAAWDDVLACGMQVENSLIYWWRHDRPETLRKALAGGYRTVLCPRKPLYFDFVQHEDHKWGRIWDGFCPLEDVYAFPDAWLEGWGLTSDDLAPVAGIHANLWSELTHTPERVDFMIWPRLCALAEAAWSQPETKDYDRFLDRLNDAYARFDRDGVYYFDARDAAHHAEPAGPMIRKKGEPEMDFRD